MAAGKANVYEMVTARIIAELPSYSGRICNHDIPHKQRTFC